MRMLIMSARALAPRNPQAFFLAATQPRHLRRPPQHGSTTLPFTEL